MTVTGVGGAHSFIIAEYVLAAILCLFKQLPLLIAEGAQRRWTRIVPDTLHGSTVGLVGFGNIGQAVARLLQPFACDILAWRRTAAPQDNRGGPRILTAREGLGILLRESDVVVLALPATTSTTNLIGAEELATMKRSAVLVNVGRGQVVNEAALASALEDGTLGGAAFDVFSVEPLPPTSALWQTPRTLVSAHIAAGSPRYDELAVEVFASNLGRFLRGEIASALCGLLAITTLLVTADALDTSLNRFASDTWTNELVPYFYQHAVSRRYIGLAAFYAQLVFAAAVLDPALGTVAVILILNAGYTYWFIRRERPLELFLRRAFTITLIVFVTNVAIRDHQLVSRTPPPPRATSGGSVR